MNANFNSDEIIFPLSNVKDHKSKLSENIFLKQKLKITDLLNKRPILQINNNDDIFLKRKLIHFNNRDKEIIDDWECSKFLLDIETLQELASVEKTFLFSTPTFSPNPFGIDITGLLIKSKDIIDYENSILDLKINFSLKGESSLWLFLRTLEKFDEFTSVIRFYKEDKCKKIFIQFGAFIKDENENLSFCIFSTQQLIEITKIVNRYNLENDIYNIQLHLSDHGENIVATSTKINNNSYENLVKTHIFLPFYRKSKVSISGEGQEVIIQEIIGRRKYRELNTVQNMDYSSNLLNSSLFTNEKRNCDCCIIF